LSAENVGNKLTSTNQFAEPKTTSGCFVVVKYNVTNTSGKEDFLTITPKLYTDEGEYEEASIMGLSLYLGEGCESISMKKLPNKISKTFYAVFEVPNSKGAKYQVRSLSAFGDKRLVDLGL
jgi:hypothetical protein